MKILIVSDTHGRDDNLRKVIELQSPFDMMIHLGDTEGSEDYFEEWVGNDNCEIHVVRGNNDYFCTTPNEEEFYIGKFKAFITHGHHYGVNMGPEMLEDEARDRGADIVMYGHTHRPYLRRLDDGLIVLNPGSISFPRQEGRKYSYALMDIDREGQAHFTIVYL